MSGLDASAPEISAAPEEVPPLPVAQPFADRLEPPIESRAVTLHGHRVFYRFGGDGPLLVLLHGIGGSSETWLDVLPILARRYSVLAPDLLGHGQSAKPRADYSVGAHASVLRDLLTALGHQRGTLVGHSFGGGIAMQFAYQFPGMVERLILVASGGLGKEVHLSLRAAALPGAEYVLPFLCSPFVRNLGDAVAGALTRAGVRAAPDMEEFWLSFRSLSSREARAAFLHTARAVIDMGGQRINAADRIYLAKHAPTLLLWGERDPIIPLEHGRVAEQLIEGSRLVTFPRSGHFPHRDEPRAFADAIHEFCSTTEPSVVEPEEWGRLLRETEGDDAAP
jgi:pimeloyl-ACP methyl ester carboxylesterase